EPGGRSAARHPMRDARRSSLRGRRRGNEIAQISASAPDLTNPNQGTCCFHAGFYASCICIALGRCWKLTVRYGEQAAKSITSCRPWPGGWGGKRTVESQSVGSLM